MSDQSLIGLIKNSECPTPVNTIEEAGFNRGLREAISIIRQHQAAPSDDVVEMVAGAMKIAETIRSDWSSRAKAAIAAMQDYAGDVGSREAPGGNETPAKSSPAPNMGDASTRKDEGDTGTTVLATTASSFAASPLYPSEISVINAFRKELAERLWVISTEGYDIQEWLEFLRSYLRTMEPVSRKDAAEALSKAILEAHAKWQVDYQGVGHVG